MCSFYRRKWLHRGLRDLSVGLLLVGGGTLRSRFTTFSLKFTQSHVTAPGCPILGTVSDTDGALKAIRDTVSSQTPKLIRGLQANQVNFFIITQDRNSGVVPNQTMMHFQMNEGEILTDLSCFTVSVLNSTKYRRKRYMLRLLHFFPSYKIQLWIHE